MFKVAFSSDDNEVIADAVGVWIVDGGFPVSCTRYLARRRERDEPFSPRLRRVVVCAIVRIWRSELKVSGPGTIRLLDHLSVGMGNIVDKEKWGELLVNAIYCPMGPESLSLHYWHLLLLLGVPAADLESRGMGVAKLLEEVQDWEKLEVWIVIAWSLLPCVSAHPTHCISVLIPPFFLQSTDSRSTTRSPPIWGRRYFLSPFFCICYGLVSRRLCYYWTMQSSNV